MHRAGLRDRPGRAAALIRLERRAIGMKPVGSTALELSAALDADHQRYGDIIRKRNIVAN